MSCHITIVGGGIIGLTTACTLLKEYSANPNLQLQIISEAFSPNTTGDVSAGLWEPYGLGLNDEKMLQWAQYAYDIFISEFSSTKAARAGIMTMPCYALHGFNGDDQGKAMVKPDFLKLVRHYRILDERELGTFDRTRPSAGFVMSTVTIEVQQYLRELRRFLSQDRRVKFVRRKILSFNDVANETDLIVNCTGLGARHLANDNTVRPARGQIIRVQAPWIKSTYTFSTEEGDGYIIPQASCVVLGGTFQLNDWNTSAVQSDTRKILRMCSKFLPALEQLRCGRVQVGLRPYRDGGVRLEHEQTTAGLHIVHCYGHSGAGVTLSWGCAKDVVDIIKTILPCQSQQPDDAKNQLPLHEQLWRLVECMPNTHLQAKL